MFIAGLFAVAKRWKQAKCPSVDEKIIMEYAYNGTLFNHFFKKQAHVTTWMDFRNIMLSERRQSQKVTCRITPFKGNVQNKYIHRDRQQTGGCEVWKQGGMGSNCLIGRGFPFRVIKLFQNQIEVVL